jgi:hypothetical protein
MNPNLTPGPPEGQEPIEQLFRDVFELADETAQRITDTEVDARLDRFSGRMAVPPRPARNLIRQRSWTLPAARPGRSSLTRSARLRRRQQRPPAPRSQPGKRPAVRPTSSWPRPMDTPTQH